MVACTAAAKATKILKRFGFFYLFYFIFIYIALIAFHLCGLFVIFVVLWLTNEKTKKNKRSKERGPSCTALSCKSVVSKWASSKRGLARPCGRHYSYIRVERLLFTLDFFLFFFFNNCLRSLFASPYLYS